MPFRGGLLQQRHGVGRSPRPAGPPRTPRRTAAPSSPSTARRDRSSRAVSARWSANSAGSPMSSAASARRQHRGEIRRMRHERRRDAETPRAQNPRRARPTCATTCRARCCGPRAIGRRVKSATDATGPSDPMHDAGHDAIAGPIEIRDRRHHAEVDLAGVEQPRALGRHVEPQRDDVGPRARARRRAAARSGS